MSTTMILMIGLALTILCSLALQLFWISEAPRGWEDEATFHFGEEPYHDKASHPGKARGPE